MRHEDARVLAQSDNRYCIGNASDLSPRLVRLDSVSILSRQSDLDQVRAISVGLSARAWKHVAMILMVLTLGIGNVWGTAPATSADTPGASGTVTFSEWTSLTKEQNYWKDGIKFWPYANLTSISNGSFTTSVPVHGYNANITAGSGWGSYTMSGLTTYAHFALGVSVKSAALVEIVVDNNQNNDLTLTRLSIKKDDVAYAADYTGSNYTTGTDIKSKATITRLDAGTGHYKISIPVTSSDLASSDPYIIKLSAATWDDPCAFVFESVTVTTCTAPNHVDISGTNKYLGGQTISLTATAYSSEGTGSPIAAANITGYQWQKEINSVWTDVENGSGVSGATTNNLQISSCDHNNSGQYRCVVSTGATCSTNSGAYGVHVFSVYGGYVGEDWSDSEIEFSSGTTGSATVHLNAGSLYKFHIRSNDGAYYSNGVADYNGDGNADDTSDGWYVLKSVSGWSFGRSNKNFRIYAGPEGDYTITVDIANALVSGDYVTVDITYPTVTHPADGYVYFEKPNNWTNVYLYWYNDNNSRLTSWDGSPEITTTASICGTTYYYTSLGTTFGNMIFKGNGTNKWTAISTSSCGGKYLDKTTYDSPAWASFPTYTISFDGNGETSGSMSNIEDIDASTNQTITTNAFSKTGYTFAGWKADVDVKINGSTVSAGTVIANGATLQNICGDIELTAQWNVNSYDLTWNLGGGTTSSAGTGIASGVSANTTSSTAYGTSLSAPTVTKTGYEFAAWDPSVAGTMPAEATTYTATWTAQHYDISYKDQGHVDFTGIHENDKPSKHTYGSETTLKTAFKDGYMFGGWFGNSSCTGSALTSLGATDYTAKVYLYAKWTAMNLDALESGTLYRVEDMVPAGVTIGASTPYYPGVSANNRFNIRGSSKSADNPTAGMCPRADARTIGGVEFTKVYGFRKPASGTDGTDLGTSLPDNHAIQFKISGDGLLDIYCYYADSIYLVKDGGSAIVLSASKSLQKVTKEVTAGTYYLYSTHVGSNQRLYGLKFTPTYTLTASATVNNPMKAESQSGDITATITNSPVSGIVSGTTTSTSSNTFTVAKATPVTVTAPTTVDSEEGECDGCIYRFDSWENIPSTVTADVSTIHAKYNTTYTISFKETDGTAVAGISSTYYVYGTGKAVSAYPTPTKSDYAFDGWYQEYTLTNEAEDIDDEVYGNITVYAKWTEAGSDYTLTWDFNGGGCTETAGDDYTAGGDVTPGTTLVYPSNSSMSKPGYKFNGWSSSPSTMPESDLTLTAQWTSFTMPNVSGLGVDDGATLSSIPLSWKIPGICDLSSPVTPLAQQTGTTSSMNYSSANDDVTVVGTMPQYQQFGVGFTIPATTGIEWISYDFKGSVGSGDHIWGGASDGTYAYWQFENPMSDTKIITSSWKNSGHDVVNRGYWDATDIVTNPLTQSCTQIAIYANTAILEGSSGTFYVRNVRYGVSDREDIDHVVLMRKEGSAATGIADPSATKLYEGTKSHYTDASDVTGKNYYYTVFAVHANGAVSTGVSTSLTLYTITYDAGENGSGTVAADKKTHGIDFTLSSSTFTQEGYTQDGWSTSDGGSKVYELGGTYSTDADVTLYPHWVADAAEDITNGNPSNGTISITDGVSSLSKASAGATVTITATPATGYNFTSWDVYKTGESSTKVSTAAATSSTTFTMPSYAVTVDASFSAKTYTVTLNGNGGSGNTANVTATYNSSTLSSSITNPTKTGYIFDGWYSGEGGTGSLIISTSGVLQASVSGYTGAGGIWTKDAATTLYARWITILPATLDKSNYSAVSDGLPWWTTDNDYFDIGPNDAANTDSYVEWSVYLVPCKYSVSITGYYPNGHEWKVTLKDTEKSYSTERTWSTGYLTENGGSTWDLSDLEAGVYTVRVQNVFGFSQPKLLSLTLSATVYTVTYDANGGTCGTESETVCGGSAVTLPSALGDGAFEGWYTSSDEEKGGAGDSYVPTADITLYAHWGASCSDPDAPTDFDLSSSTMTTATFAITDDENAASYDLYYASGSPSTPTSGTTATQSVTTKTPTITGLTASTEYKIWVRSVCDATHKSDWVALEAEGGAFTTPAPETYTITYNTDGAAEDQISDGEKTEGTNFTLSSTRYTKAGYWHVGWATSQGGSKVYNFGGTYSMDADLALYPAWVKLAVYNPDMSTETKLTTTIGAKFGGVDRWTLTTGSTLVSTPKDVSSTAEENLTGEKYGLAFTPNWSSNALYDLGAQTTLYQLTLDIVMGGDGSLTAELLNGSSGVVKTITNDIRINNFTAWEKKTFTYTYDAGLANVRYIRIYGNGAYVVGLTRIKAEYAPTKTEIVLDNQSATSDGTTSVTATYGASTNLTSDITAPTKTNYIFGGYYTEESGAGTQLIDENGAWLASKTDYTDGSKNWQFANPDLTLYAKWTAKTTPTKYNVTAETIGSCNEASVTIILEDSEDGVTYELYKDGSATGTTKTGTGEALNWSGITAAGEYTIWTVEDETYASVQMDNDGYTTVTVVVKDDAELAYDDDEIEKNVGDAAFTNTLTNSHSVSVTYESSDEDVATVETDGEVTIVGAGSTTITASFTGDATYCAASVSYTLTVYPVYTVTYIAMGGSCSPTSANTTTDLGKVTLPSASHDDYSSYTWVTSDGTEAGAAGDEYEPSGNITLYAKWSGSCASTCYTVTYHGNGATSGYVNDPVQYASGTTVYVSSSTGSYTRDGYEFNGWNTAANGSGTKVAYFTITGNTMLYAQWKYVINSNNTDFSGYAAAPTQYQDVKVTNGATLTITSTRTIHDLTIETGSTLNVSTTNGDGTGDGVTFTVNSLHLKGGWNSNYTKYDMPRVYIDRLSSLVKDAENPIVNFDISVDSRTYYPFAVPFRVKVSDINYADPTLAYYAQYGATGQYVIKEYDGERRAEKGPDHENNWKVVPQEDKEGNDVYLEPGRGYILTAVSLPAYGGGVIRIPLSFTNAWTALGEQGTVSAVTKNIVPVTAYTGKATEGDKFANKGWNLLGVPFMSCYTTSDDMGTSVVMQGKFNFETGEWDGEDKVRYVNVPMHDFSEYVQVDMEDEKTPTVLRPGWCFFVQIGTTGNLTFLTADQAASSSLPIYAPKREKANMPIVKTGIILSDGEKSDQTTFLVSDKYSAMDYEINADLEKLFGNGYTLATYSLSGETRLAYNALSNADAANIIPIGYRAPAEGEYTFSINPSYAENGAFESVNLIDYETGIVTDLSQSSYTFSTERTQDDARFALNVVPRQETPTDLEDVQGDDVQGARVRKLLIEDKLFIIRDGVMYDATGKKVKGGAQ